MNLFQVTKKQEGGDLSLQTFTGNPVTFTPSYSEALPAPFNGIGLKASIVAKQDLHGYDHPWAGGGGKNKTDISDNTISGADYVIGGFPVAINADNIVLPSGNYVFSFNLTGATYPCACQLIWYRNGVEVGNTTEAINSSGINSIAFTASGEFDSFVMFCNSSSGGAFTNFNLNIGSTPSPYEPYSNICPIVGHSELNLIRYGVNLWDEQTEKGNIDTTTGENTPYNYMLRSVNYIKVSPNTTLYTPVSWIQCYFYDANKTYISYQAFAAHTINVPNNAEYMRFRLSSDYGTTYNNDISINYPSTDTSYHAYNGQTFTVSFGQTVYGGVYDANAGKVRIKHAGTTLNGSEAIDVTDAGQSTQMFVVPAVGVPVVSTIGFDSTDLLCNAYTACAWSDNPWYVNNSISFYVYDGTLRIKDDACADVAAFKAYLANNPVTIIYPLATPIEIDVSELSVAAIVGVNNIVSDCGGDITVTCLI